MLSVELARSSVLFMRRVTGDATSSVARVRRVLFNEPLNHEETRRDLIRETEHLSSEMRQRWNFDFDTETPLPGRYEWQRTSGRETVHPAYALRHLTRVPSSTAVSTSASAATVSGDDNSVNSKSQELKVTPDKTSKTKGTSATKTVQKVQKKVTDFMPQRKRPLIKTSTAPSPSPKNKVRRTTTT